MLRPSRGAQEDEPEVLVTGDTVLGSLKLLKAFGVMEKPQSVTRRDGRCGRISGRVSANPSTRPKSMGLCSQAGGRDGRTARAAFLFYRFTNT